MRLRWLAVGVLAFAGCTSLPSPDHEVSSAPTENQATTEAGLSLPDDDPLTLAAECLQRGDEPGACTHLDLYVRRHPDQPAFRVQLAELLLKTGKPELARLHLERFAADAQDVAALRGQLVQCHTRLMELARDADDPFGEQFHRGVGLLRLVEQRGDELDEPVREELLCKAMKSLAAAKELRPADARVRLYLADAYEQLGNGKGADSERAAARNAARPGSFTPAEQRRLAGPIK
jgi:predicted Zn-dependent protease